MGACPKRTYRSRTRPRLASPGRTARRPWGEITRPPRLRAYTAVHKPGGTQQVGFGGKRDPSGPLDQLEDGGGGSSEGCGGCAVIGDEGEVLAGDPGTG